MRSSLLLGFFLVVGVGGSKAIRAEVDFAHEVVPILRQHCGECHTGDAKKGGFSLNDRQSLLEGSEGGSMVSVGKSGESYLIELVTSRDEDLQMPPQGPRLTEAEVATLRRWIDEGVSWEVGFAFKKGPYEPPVLPRKPELPPSVEGRDHPIDRIVDRYFAENQIPRPSRLEDLAFLRRTSLDLVGLLPNPDRVQAFVADTSPDKRERWIANLLADDIDYADHWLSFWNDLLRNDYSGTGFITGGRKQISNWLYRSLANNKPFDQFARELIAPERDESRGFIEGIKWRGDVSAGQTVEIQFSQSVAQSFLGINMKCASCHDSFIDRWKLSEAYGLAAVYSTRELEIARCDMHTGVKAKAAWLFPELGSIDPEAPQPERLRQLAALMTDSKNGRFARTIANRFWHRLMGRGIVHPVDSMQSEPWSVDLLDYLADYLVEHRYDLRKLLAHIATSQVYQSNAEVMESGTDGDGYRFRGPRAKRMTAEQFVDAVWTLTQAAPSKYDAPVLRGSMSDQDSIETMPRGTWIWADVDPQGAKNNKAKALLFRTTLKLDEDVALAAAMITVSDQYNLFVNNREVASDQNWKSLEMIPIHHQLRKGNNAIAILAVGTTADLSKGGVYFDARIRLASGKLVSLASDESWTVTATLPAMNEKRLSGLDKESFYPAKSIKPLAAWEQAVDEQSPPLLSQTLGGEPRMVRASLMKSDFLMRTLGRPNRDQIVSMRPNELTTLEAIDLANGQTFANYLAAGAKAYGQQKWKDTDGMVEALYRFSLTREPTGEEREIALSSLGQSPDQQAIEDFLWALCMSPEFQYVR